MEDDKEKSEVGEAIRRLQRKAQLPNEIFAEALKEYEKVDEENWAEHFPPGFRERVAPTWLGEVYSSQKIGKELSKEWIKRRQLGDCAEARELISNLAALDHIFLHDRSRGAINQIGTEKLSRKGYGIVSAFGAVPNESDGNKTSNPGKNWKSNVDYEKWRRMDPMAEDKDHLFINRKVEDEIRSEMEREAQQLKARNKLYQNTDE